MGEITKRTNTADEGKIKRRVKGEMHDNTNKTKL